MNQYLVCKTVEFDCAHSLLGHQGLCSNIHGHHYVVELKVRGDINAKPQTSDEGMITDFSQLKEVAKHTFLDAIDHALVIWEKDIELWKLVEKQRCRIYIMKTRPTAENMAKLFYELMREELRKRTVQSPNYCMMHAVRVYETPTSYAEYPFLLNGRTLND